MAARRDPEPSRTRPTRKHHEHVVLSAAGGEGAQHRDQSPSRKAGLSVNNGLFVVEVYKPRIGRPDGKIRINGTVQERKRSIKGTQVVDDVLSVDATATATNDRHTLTITRREDSDGFKEYTVTISTA